jgi:soluble lytic murein transglycosylase-like protein
VAGSPAPVDAGAPATFMGPAPAATASATPPKRDYQAPRLVQGQLYSYIKDGVRHYSSKRPHGVASASAVRTIKYSFMETCYACGAKPGVNFGNVRLNTNAFSNEIATAARDFGVDQAIVRAIIHAESAYNPNALSRVGAQGLMQLMPATARRFGVSNAFDAAQNIRGGVQYLAWLLKRFNGNLTLAAAGYNAGEGAVDKYKGVPPYSETQRYVQRVGLLADRYRATPLEFAPDCAEACLGEVGARLFAGLQSFDAGGGLSGPSPFRYTSPSFESQAGRRWRRRCDETSIHTVLRSAGWPTKGSTILSTSPLASP